MEGTISSANGSRGAETLGRVHPCTGSQMLDEGYEDCVEIARRTEPSESAAQHAAEGRAHVYPKLL
eukprot:6193235-Pleurochrysis_carterae.AAC.1